MKVSLVSVALALSAVSATDISSRATQLEEAKAVTDNLLFNINLTEFESFRADRNPGYLDWTSDSCSYSPDNPLWFPFSPGCERHDFGLICYACSEKYYWGVWFYNGGAAPGKRSEEAEAMYQVALERQETLLSEAQRLGLIPEHHEGGFALWGDPEGPAANANATAVDEFMKSVPEELLEQDRLMKMVSPRRVHN
ncbi:Phospholipase A2 [Akanthomyces lecanii RCEF 1005]|uniref:Phospholipase A2 n=1 Tax=Akanthomyces lecanii RCEF 1005 TaxID=1081108 RepID=A0A168FSK9_CORDF|nr:Phospholipase A2 [Akanthomyces lecanii RCEF 1005]